jgi:hypothetical protein
VRASKCCVVGKCPITSLSAERKTGSIRGQQEGQEANHLIADLILRKPSIDKSEEVVRCVLHKLGLENLAQPFSFFNHNESKALSKRRELGKCFLILCGFARNYSEDLSGKLSNNSMRAESFPRSGEVCKVL